MITKKLETKIEHPEERTDLNRDKIPEIFQEKLGGILNESGISPEGKIDVENVSGKSSDLVFQILSQNSAYALKIFSGTVNQNHYRANLKFDELASKKNIPVPQFIHSSADSKILPASWIIWKWISGQLLSRMEADTERAEAAEKVGKLLRQIHKIEVSGFGWPNADNEWEFTNSKGACDFFVKRIRNLTKRGERAFSEDELREIFSLTAESEELLQFNKPALLHGDLTGANVIVSDKKDITFIDPGEIVAGDPMADLGYTQTTRLSHAFREGVWKGYTKDNPLSPEEEIRFKKWRLLRQCVIACNAVMMKNKNIQKYIEDVFSFLDGVRK
jgi:aminoglycoside phosphotransferase (APT) family kinase protein